MLNNEIETDRHESAELGLEALSQVSGGGDAAVAIAYALGHAIGVTLLVGAQVAAAVHRIT